MHTLIIEKVMAGKRIDKVIRDIYPSLSNSAYYGLFKKKDIKINGVRVTEDRKVFQGDVCEIYLDDATLDAAKRPTFSATIKLDIVYEDDNLLVVNKPQGLAVHPDIVSDEPTLIDLVREKYSKSKPKNGNPPEQIELCHRIDRNTGGLVILSKNPQTLKIILEKLKDGEIKKYYRCHVYGVPVLKKATLKAYLSKDARQSKVFISDVETSGAAEIITKYKIIESYGDVSLVEIELLTGRTHQIRAHLAHIGHQVIGDGKYGQNSVNRKFGIKRQDLWAYKLEFVFTKSSGHINYLNGAVFTCNPDFQYHPLTHRKS